MSRTGICDKCGSTTCRITTKMCRACFFASLKKPYTTKEYRRNWHIKKKYGVDRDIFEVYWMACRGLCWICKKRMVMPTPTRGQGLDTVTIDHDHKTGVFRALLCSACNKGIGFLKDDVNILVSALKYLGGAYLLNEK